MLFRSLVLVERAERSQRVMRESTPHLRTGSGGYVTDRDAFGAGREAGSSFGTSGRSVRGIRRELGRG